jgi:aryl-alcohol dehydrogenase-like predicted oxidoreductase
MDTRQLGSHGLTVSAVGLGCMGMSDAYSGADEVASRETLRLAVERGVTLFDTADAYGAGANEAFIGEVLADVRDEVVLATKFANESLPDGTVRINGRPSYVFEACEASLRRLGVEVIDLYYQHRVDPEVPIEETVGAMGELVAAGKVRYLGLSEASADTVRRAHGTHPISAVQTEYSLWTRDVEAAVLPTLDELGIGFVPYSPLGRGFLTGRYRTHDQIPTGDWRAGNPRFQPDNLERNLAIVDALESAATGLGCTAGQLALAWVIARGPNIVPIPGTTRAAHLLENIAAAELELRPDQVEALAVNTPAPSGARYDDAGLAGVEA